ncbi:hypothetical protein MINTM020_25370 [Mycobacterium paraintracellulare]|uniref:HNH endonuclease signature motif containing protein n=1 Tax=Mycobacterium paraintracellulare TaxID=1138383 RepID=UPI00192608C9|nr:hypothetical protein MINTM020_25370 [Mycobacterium paraintracellulare]
MLSKPCLTCGEEAEPGRSRCRDCRPRRTRRRTRADRNRPSAWDRLAKRLCTQSPFCERCSSTDRLEADHIVPVSEDPTLALEPLNCRVLCRTCNRRRGNRCTDAERQAVHAAIASRKQRTAQVAGSS